MAADATPDPVNAVAAVTAATSASFVLEDKAVSLIRVDFELVQRVTVMGSALHACHPHEAGVRRRERAGGRTGITVRYGQRR
jgi:hypothetical protein